MKPVIFAVVALSALWALHAHAEAPPSSADVSAYCDAFTRTPDGSWRTVKPVAIQRPTGRLVLGRGLTVTRAKPMGGLDLAAALDAQCARK
jgi:hypothetical protein